VNVPVRCGCGNFFEVEAELTGGYANCPHCGKAAAVSGMRDPFWRLLQGLAALLWLAAIVVGYLAFGAVAALIAGLVVGAVLWLVSRAL